MFEVVHLRSRTLPASDAVRPVVFARPGVAGANKSRRRLARHEGPRSWTASPRGPVADGGAGLALK